MQIWDLIVLIAGVASTPLLVVSYVPQIIQLQKTKNAEGINLNFWLILSASLLCFVILAFDGFLATGAWVLLLAQIVNLLLAVVVIIQVIAYSKKKKTVVSTK